MSIGPPRCLRFCIEFFQKMQNTGRPEAKLITSYTRDSMSFESASIFKQAGNTGLLNAKRANDILIKNINCDPIWLSVIIYLRLATKQAWSEKQKNMQAKIKMPRTFTLP